MANVRGEAKEIVIGSDPTIWLEGGAALSSKTSSSSTRSSSTAREARRLLPGNCARWEGASTGITLRFLRSPSRLPTPFGTAADVDAFDPEASEPGRGLIESTSGNGRGWREGDGGS